MKKSLLVLALLSTMSSVAWATQPTPTPAQVTTNQGGTGGTSNAGALALAGSSATAFGAGGSVYAPISNKVANDVSQGQKQGQGQQQALVGSNNASLTTGTTSVTTNINNERSAPAVWAGNIPTTLYSCRLYMFGGATNTSGAVSGTLPIGNDQTCLSQIMLQMMEKVGGFTQAETQSVACKVEGMEKLETCKALVKTPAK